MNRQLSALALALLLSSPASKAAFDVECLLNGACIETKNVMSHIKALEKIAYENNGNRAAGTSGYEFSANYVAQQFLAADYKVELLPFKFMKFTMISNSVVIDGVTQVDMKDFQIMSFSGAGQADAKLIPIDVALGLGNKSTSGCEAKDFINFPKGAIALIQRGGCLFQPKLENAQAAGASGVVIFNQGNTEERTDLMGGNLDQGFTIKIPAFTVSYAKGVELIKAGSPVIQMKADSKIESKYSMNVVAETKTGNPDNIVMIGAHLDSVDDGPGVNDNATGVSSLIEAAVAMKDQNLTNKIRFAFFSAEEVGLVGSTLYVESLTAAEKLKIALYLNVDMTASPNYKLGVFDGDGSKYGQVGPQGSSGIESKFQEAYKSLGIKSVEVELDGRSDYAAFSEAGIAVGGIDTGAEKLKTDEEAALFGGQAGVAYDSCYHLACDTIANVNQEALEINSKVIASVLFDFSKSVSEIRSNKTLTSRRNNSVIFP